MSVFPIEIFVFFNDPIRLGFYPFNGDFGFFNTDICIQKHISAFKIQISAFKIQISAFKCRYLY